MAPAIAAAIAFLLMSGVTFAQVARGTAAPGVQFGAPILKASPPPPPPQIPAPSPPRHHPRFEDHFTPLPDQNDLFRAKPDTYKVRDDASPFVPGPHFFPTIFPVHATPEVVVQPVVIERPVVVERVVVREPERVLPEPPPAAAPAAPAIVAPQKTIYVIPRCYAGDKPPDVSRLPAGCDIRNMKVIRP